MAAKFVILWQLIVLCTVVTSKVILHKYSRGASVASDYHTISLHCSLGLWLTRYHHFSLTYLLMRCKPCQALVLKGHS